MHSFIISEWSPIKLVCFINDMLLYTLNQMVLSHPNDNVFKPMQTVTYWLFLTGALIKILRRLSNTPFKLRSTLKRSPLYAADLGRERHVLIKSSVQHPEGKVPHNLPSTLPFTPDSSVYEGSLLYYNPPSLPLIS